MFKYLILVLLLIFAGLAGIYFFVGVPKIHNTEYPAEAVAHLAFDPKVKIDEINISAFYFVPKNKIGRIPETWRGTLETGLINIKKFHELQTRGLSRISYEIHPEPVIGIEDSIFYDTQKTDRGNPQALIRVAEEIEERILKGKRGTGGYPVMFIMYEGVGAVGGLIQESEKETAEEIASVLKLPEEMIYIVDIGTVDGFLLVNREIVSGMHGSNGLSIAAHEFYHTLGIADKYSYEEAIAESPGLMGLGRLKPLEKTFLSRETLAELGL